MQAREPLEDSLSICSDLDAKAIFALFLKGQSYEQVFKGYSRLRKRDLKFSSKHYDSEEVYEFKTAISFLSSRVYEDLHYHFYNSFPSPELPIGLLKSFVSSGLLKLTTFRIKESGRLIGVTYSCIVGDEYYVPFFIYQRAPQSHKGISTYMWNYHIQKACGDKNHLINLGTSRIHSNVAKFKLSLGCVYLRKEASSAAISYLARSSVYGLFFRLLPRFCSKAIGYLGYKYFAGSL